LFAQTSDFYVIVVHIMRKLISTWLTYLSVVTVAFLLLLRQLGSFGLKLKFIVYLRLRAVLDFVVDVGAMFSSRNLQLFFFSLS